MLRIFSVGLSPTRVISLLYSIIGQLRAKGLYLGPDLNTVRLVEIGCRRQLVNDGTHVRKNGSGD